MLSIFELFICKPTDCMHISIPIRHSEYSGVGFLQLHLSIGCLDFCINIACILRVYFPFFIIDNCKRFTFASSELSQTSWTHTHTHTHAQANCLNMQRGKSFPQSCQLVAHKHTEKAKKSLCAYMKILNQQQNVCDG